VRTDDTIYLVKISTKLSERMVNYDEDDDIIVPLESVKGIDLGEEEMEQEDEEDDTEEKIEFDDEDDIDDDKEYVDKSNNDEDEDDE
jgi:hypothetical protein